MPAGNTAIWIYNKIVSIHFSTISWKAVWEKTMFQCYSFTKYIEQRCKQAATKAVEICIVTFSMSTNINISSQILKKSGTYYSIYIRYRKWHMFLLLKWNVLCLHYDLLLHCLCFRIKEDDAFRTFREKGIELDLIWRDTRCVGDIGMIEMVDLWENDGPIDVFIGKCWFTVILREKSNVSE